MVIPYTFDYKPVVRFLSYAHDHIGKKVDQYHEERIGKKTVISLGYFDKEKHIEWLDKNPAKRPKPVDSRKYVSHFYSGGDICDLTSGYFTTSPLWDPRNIRASPRPLQIVRGRSRSS